MFRVGATAVLALTAISPAAAVVTMGAITGGTPGITFSIIPAPAAVPVAPPAAIVVAFDEGRSVVTSTIFPTLGSIVAAGTNVFSHFVAFEVTSGSSNRDAIGFVTFDRPVLAVIGSSAVLTATNYLGAPGTTYTPSLYWGLEWSDVNAVAPRTGTYIVGNTVYFDWRTNKIGPDSMRVLTLVPEASTWAMLIAGFGLVGFASRRRRSAFAA
jgi:hypothetical protein